MHNSVMFAIYLFGCMWFRHLCRHIHTVISVYDIYAKISVYEIKIGTLNAPLIFHHQIMFTNESWGQLLTTITQILVRLVIVAIKYVIHYIYAKITLVSPASIFVGELLQRQGHFWAWPLYILLKCDVRHRLHCFVLTRYCINLRREKLTL